MASIIEMQVPSFETILPVSGKKIKYRPFVVKEQKILILALEEGSIPAIINALNQLFELCTFGECNIDNICRADAEYLFVKMRNKAMGETVDVWGPCKACGDKSTIVQLDFDKATIKNHENSGTTVKIEDDMWVELSPPTLRVAYDSLQSNVNSDYVTASSIKSLIIGDVTKTFSEYTIDERIDFVERLTHLQASKMTPFFESLPVLTLKHTFTCKKCGSEQEIELEGIEDFFM